MDTGQVLAVIGAGSAVANIVFWGSYLLGKMRADIDRLVTRVDDHDDDILHLKESRR